MWLVCPLQASQVEEEVGELMASVEGGQVRIVTGVSQIVVVQDANYRKGKKL